MESLEITSYFHIITQTLIRKYIKNLFFSYFYFFQFPVFVNSKSPIRLQMIFPISTSYYLDPLVYDRDIKKHKCIIFRRKRKSEPPLQYKNNLFTLMQNLFLIYSGLSFTSIILLPMTVFVILRIIVQFLSFKRLNGILSQSFGAYFCLFF